MAHHRRRPGPTASSLGLHEQVLDDTVFYALLDPADRGVRVLGAATDVSGDCQTTDEVLVCRRIDASVGIWQLK